MAGLRGGVGTLVLDADGLSKFAEGNSRAVSFAKDAYDLRAPVVVAASTLTEVLGGSTRDSHVHRVLRRIDISPIDMTKARAAGELLGRLGCPDTSTPSTRWWRLSPLPSPGRLFFLLAILTI